MSPPESNERRGYGFGKSLLAFVLLMLISFPTIYALGMTMALNVWPPLYIELYHPLLQDPNWRPSNTYWACVGLFAFASAALALLGTLFLSCRHRPGN